MSCKKLQQNLSDLIDRELSSSERPELENHLADCPDCSLLYREFVLVKRLVQERAWHSEAPSGLQARIEEARRGARRVDYRSRFRAAAVAAALLLGVFALLTWYVTEPRLSHAAVSTGCVKIFEESLAEGVVMEGLEGDTPDEWQAQVHEEVCQRLRVRLSELPGIADARFLACRETSIRGIKSVRLDFRPRQKGANTDTRALISVFLLPRKYVHAEDSLKGPKLHCCTDCVGMKGGNVFCFFKEDVLVSVVANMRREALEARLTG